MIITFSKLFINYRGVTDAYDAWIMFLCLSLEVNEYLACM